MTRQLIRLCFSDHTSRTNKGQREVLQVMWSLSTQVTDCSATRIPFSGITGHHPWPTDGPIEWVLPSADVQLNRKTQDSSYLISIFLLLLSCIRFNDVHVVQLTYQRQSTGLRSHLFVWSMFSGRYVCKNELEREN